MSVNEKMTAIADETRTLVGGTEKMGLDAIATNLNTANGVVTTQADLIAQIAAKVDSLPEAGSGGSATIESLTITQNGTYTAENGVDGYSPIVVNVAGSGSSDNSMTQFIEGYLTYLYNDVAESVTDRAFYGVYSLEKVVLPNVTDINGYAFADCEALYQVDLSKVGGIYFSAFDTTALKALIIRNTEMVPELWDINAFHNTPISLGYGYIYVPQALIESYRVATNWANFADQLRILEDYTADGTVTGEFILPEEEGAIEYPVALINGELAGLSITALPGMTWSEWMNSEYYNGMFYIDEDGRIVCAADTEYYVIFPLDDSGESWSLANPGIPIDPYGINAIVIATLADIGLE